MSDDHHGDDGHDYRRPFVVTPDQERQLLNLVEDAKKLETFTDEAKAALKLLVADAPELHAMADNRRGWTAFRKKIKWFFIQLSALLGALVALNEIVSNYMKWRGIK